MISRENSLDAVTRECMEISLDENLSMEKILAWSKNFNPCVVLNSNQSKQLQIDIFSKFDLLIAAGAIEKIPTGNNVFDAVKLFHENSSDWIFGYISYDVKNQLEKLSSENFDGIKADDFFFYRPQYVLALNDNRLKILYNSNFDDAASIQKLISGIKNTTPADGLRSNPGIQARVSKEKYIANVNAIRAHIKRGDIYEMNYCIEFFADDASIDPFIVYEELNKLSPMPFSAFLRCDDHHLMCASPERFIAKRERKIISQPIKGTARRSNDSGTDEQIKNSLLNDPKERSENVMIVDLVRNDLSRTALRGSVKGENLFSIHTFSHLHQMVSTVTSELKEGVHFMEAIRHAFPMGSMTGAPKIRAMELIEEFEVSKRGIYSGTIGYITPDGDFDFNVIIRSILYNSKSGYLSFMAGSAITDGADAEKEYEECLLKARAMQKVFDPHH